MHDIRKLEISTEENLIYRREIGSKFAIANRVFYNSLSVPCLLSHYGLPSNTFSSLLLQKLVLLDVYRRLLLNLRYEKIIMISFLVVFFVTYVAVQVTTFSECKPFHLYWQVVPDPGKLR